MARVRNLQFTKTWRDRTAFPTYSDDEEQIRADLQCLFDEIKDYVNQHLLPAVNTITAGEIASDGGSTVQSELDAVREGLAGVVLGQLPDGSLTAEKIADDCFAWTDVLDENDVETLETYADADYTSNGLKFYHCASLQMMRVEGYVTFTPANATVPYATFSLPAPVPAGGAIPLTAGVIGNARRTDLTARAEIRQGGYLDVYLGGWKQADRGSAIRVFVHGWYLCEEASV